MNMFDTNRLIKIARHSQGLGVPSWHMAITDECFNHCPMCGHWKRKHKSVMSSERILQFAAAAQGCLGLETIALTGGDPLAHKEICAILQGLMDQRITFGIVTAGYVPDIRIIDLLVCAKWVRVSLDAVDPDIYSRARGGSITYCQVEQSLLKMMDAGVNVQFGITVNSVNSTHLPAILSQICEWAAAYRLFTSRVSKVAVRAVYHHSEHLQAQEVPVEEVQHFVKELETLGVECEIELSRTPLHSFNHCHAVHYQLFVDANGDVYPCCVMGGDTESKSLTTPIGTVDNPQELLASSKRWRELHVSSLPPDCLCDCPTRLNIINHCWPSIDARKDFY